MGEITNPVPLRTEALLEGQQSLIKRNWWEFFRKLAIPANNGSGTTLKRPATPILYGVYFDTDLGYPVWHDGTNWVDATGTPA